MSNDAVPQPGQSDTAMTTPLLHAIACECCQNHDVQAVPVDEVVMCKMCGQECSCRGCIAEADDA